jgi:hypothetical protein
VRRKPVVLLRAERELSTVTDAFGTTAPFGSLTVISMLPVVSCAEAAPKVSRKQNRSEEIRFNIFIFIPLIIYKFRAASSSTQFGVRLFLL